MEQIKDFGIKKAENAFKKWILKQRRKNGRQIFKANHKRCF